MKPLQNLLVVFLIFVVSCKSESSENDTPSVSQRVFEIKGDSLSRVEIHPEKVAADEKTIIEHQSYAEQALKDYKKIDPRYSGKYAAIVDIKGKPWLVFVNVSKVTAQEIFNHYMDIIRNSKNALYNYKIQGAYFPLIEADNINETGKNLVDSVTGKQFYYEGLLDSTGKLSNADFSVYHGATVFYEEKIDWSKYNNEIDIGRFLDKPSVMAKKIGSAYYNDIAIDKALILKDKDVQSFISRNYLIQNTLKSEDGQ